MGSSVAAGSAAGATRDATNASINAQTSAQDKAIALNAPYAAIGTGTPGTPGSPSTIGPNGRPIIGSPGTPGTKGAIAQYQDLLGLGPQGSAGIESTLAATPGYQFAKSQGLEATLNAATLTNPGGVSGNTLEALDRYSTGLADSTYQQAVGNAQNAVTIGQNAAAGTGSGILQTGANIGTTISNAGNTLAGIQANQVAGISNAASGALSNYATLNTLNNLNSPSFTPDSYYTGGYAAQDAAGQLPAVEPIPLG